MLISAKYCHFCETEHGNSLKIGYTTPVLSFKDQTFILRILNRGVENTPLMELEQSNTLVTIGLTYLTHEKLGECKFRRKKIKYFQQEI